MQQKTFSFLLISGQFYPLFVLLRSGYRPSCLTDLACSMKIQLPQILKWIVSWASFAPSASLKKIIFAFLCGWWCKKDIRAYSMATSYDQTERCTSRIVVLYIRGGALVRASRGSSCIDEAEVEPLHRLARRDNPSLKCQKSRILMRSCPSFPQIVANSIKTLTRPMPSSQAPFLLPWPYLAVIGIC